MNLSKSENYEKIYFKYKPIEYFKQSEYYNLIRNNTINKLSRQSIDEYFEINAIGEKFLNRAHLHTTVKSNIIQKNDKLQEGIVLDGQIGIRVYEQNGDTYFHIIIEDVIGKIYSKEEYPEYYL